MSVAGIPGKRVEVERGEISIRVPTKPQPAAACHRGARQPGKHIMTADQLKAAVREYADREFPGGWDGAGVTISRGPGEEPETLIIRPQTPPPSAPPLPSVSPR